MALQMADVVIIMIHPILGTIAAYMIYKQWISLKSRKIQIQGQKSRKETIMMHQESGRKITRMVGIVILFAVLGDAYRRFRLDTPLSELMSLHGWLGLTLFGAIFVMGRIGERLSDAALKKEDYLQDKKRHSKIGGMMMILLGTIVFLGFLRLLDILG